MIQNSTILYAQWGVSPSHPRIIDKQELLERFYFIHNPSSKLKFLFDIHTRSQVFVPNQIWCKYTDVFRVGDILKHWKGRYFQLWRALRDKYGRDPSNLFPLQEGPRISAELTHEEGEAVNFLLDELGYFPKNNSTKPEANGVRKDDIRGASVKSPSSEAKKLLSAQKQMKDESLKPKQWLPEGFSVNSSEIASSLSLFSEAETNSINDNSTHTAGSVPNSSTQVSRPVVDTGKKTPPKHLLTVWDYQANFGGELYTGEFT